MGDFLSWQSLFGWGLCFPWLRCLQALKDRIIFQAELFRHIRTLYSIFLMISLANAR
jgi:hypothetical protein